MKPSPSDSDYAADVKAMRAVLQRRHGGKWTVLFCDGHVESLTTANLFDTRKASVRMRWNNDNLPDH
jgi:prepilin-type processing-associated H-X9-DG protein